MLNLFIRKLLQGLIMVLVVSAAAFALLSSAGGDALSGLRENPQISEETIEDLRRVYELDRPLAVRYTKWLSGATAGDLGDSLYFRTPVAGLISSRFFSTLLLGLAALGIAFVTAAALSLAAARYRSRALLRLIDFVVLITASTPRMVLALFALAITAQYSGAVFGANSALTFWLAAAALSAPLTSVFLAQGNAELTNAMNEDFVRLARAKGLSERVVILKHAVRAALNPLLTIFGLSLGGVLGGSVIVETVLGRSGLGSLMVSAVRNRDIPLVMGIVLLTSIAVWLGNALAELLQVINDKRLRSVERL